MFLISQNEYYSIEHTKSELIKLLSQMRQEIAASRQSQTSMACSHIEYCLEHLRNARSTIAVSLPVKSLDLEITSMLGQQHSGPTTRSAQKLGSSQNIDPSVWSF